MMPKEPTVAVVMCTYNGSRFIDEQIDSIVRQTFPITELVIVDDRSTDDTWAKLQAWQAKHPIIKLFQNEQNLGYNKNFEKAISLTNADLIALSDQDDIWLPQKVGQLVPSFHKEGTILAHCRSVRFEHGELRYKLAKLHHHFSGSDTKELLFFNHIMGHDMVFRRKLVDKIVPIPDGVSYDWWIAVMATCQGSVAGVNEFLVHHRIHAQNNFFTTAASTKKKELDLEETLIAFHGIAAMREGDKKYLAQLIKLLAEKREQSPDKFYRPLFDFLYRNRQIIFGHKRRFMQELSFFKNARKYAKINYVGKGLSF